MRIALAALVALASPTAMALPGDVVERSIVLETPPVEHARTQVEGLEEWSELPDDSSVLCEADGRIPPSLSVHQPRTNRRDAPRPSNGLLLVPEIDDSNREGTYRLLDPSGTELRLHYEIVVSSRVEDGKPFCSVEAVLVEPGG